MPARSVLGTRHWDHYPTLGLLKHFSVNHSVLVTCSHCKMSNTWNKAFVLWTTICHVTLAESSNLHMCYSLTVPNCRRDSKVSVAGVKAWVEVFAQCGHPASARRKQLVLHVYNDSIKMMPCRLGGRLCLSDSQILQGCRELRYRACSVMEGRLKKKN